MHYNNVTVCYILHYTLLWVPAVSFARCLCGRLAGPPGDPSRRNGMALVVDQMLRHATRTITKPMKHHGTMSSTSSPGHHRVITESSPSHHPSLKCHEQNHKRNKGTAFRRRWSIGSNWRHRCRSSHHTVRSARLLVPCSARCRHHQTSLEHDHQSSCQAWLMFWGFSFSLRCLKPEASPKQGQLMSI